LGAGEALPLSDIRSEGAYRFRHAQLLTLSACETGISQSEGTGLEVDSSLATLVQDAGAPAVLASLWSVADESTSELMRDFYRQYASGPKTKAQALRQAQLAMIDGQGAAGGRAQRNAVKKGPAAVPAAAVGHDHPFFWAPFVLSGNWT
jgi:CHAT domain-containing protein